MAYNNSYPESIDEIILPTTDYTGVKDTNKDIDFVQDWVDVTVENEIKRGRQLRKEKPIPDDSEYEYNVANIDFLGSFVKGNRHSRRRDHLKYYKIKKSGLSSPKSKSPYRRSNSAVCAFYQMNRNVRLHNQQTKTKNPKKCSMRIAELAVPSKRQCLDTWRYKSRLLPEFMVLRLKQHVLDQRPIVEIPEALYCFQNRRPRRQRPSKNSFKNSQNRNENVYDLRKPPREMDERTLCILFAHKITKILLKPLNLTLNLELETIARVISSDIAKLLCKCAFTKNRQYLPIQRDVVKKITVWIAGILEDLTLKLLEEDLRVKMETNATENNSDQFETVVETLLQQEKFTTKATDLEEEEGPVLDFIDDVVENVLNICEPYPVYVEPELDTAAISKDDEIIGEEPEKSLSPIYSTNLEIPRLEEFFNIDTVAALEGLIDEVNEETLTDSEHFRNEINDILDYVTKNSGDEMSNGSGDDLEIVFEKTLTPQGEDLGTKTINDDAQNVIQNNEIEEAGENSEVNDANVSEDFGILTEDDDKNDKKVMFIKTGLVNLHDLAKQNETSTDDVFSKSDQDQQANALSVKSSVTFAEPNENLLSDADELWPADSINKTMVNLDNVSKSVMSLGQINENDERQLSPKDGADKTEESISGDSQLLEETIVGKLNSLLPSEKHSSESQLNKAPQEITSADLQSDSKTLVNKESDELESKVIDEPSKEEVQQIMKTESDIGGTISSTGGSEGAILPKYKVDNNMIDETKSGDTQLSQKMTRGKLHDLLSTGKMKSKSGSQLNVLQQKTSKETTQAEPQVDSGREYSDEFESEAVEEAHDMIGIENDILGTEGATGPSEESQILSPETPPPIDNEFSQINENNERQISPTGEVDMTDETKSLDKLLSQLLTDKHESESELQIPQQEISIEPTAVELQVDSERPDITDTDELESKVVDEPSTEEVNKIIELETDTVETGAGISEENEMPSPETQIDHGLSKIKENDERQISLKGQAVTIDEKKSFDTQLIENIIVDKLFREPPKKYGTKKQLKPQQKKPLKKATTAKPQVAAKKLHKPKTGLESKPSLEEVCTIVSLESDIIETESGILEKHKIPKTQSPMDHGWKVQLHTAPSWVTAWEQGRGEPSEDSLPIEMRPTRVPEKEIRKWCKDMENAFLNLEMWSHWISHTCKETISLFEQNESVCLTLARKNAMKWVKLRSDINKDAELWMKMYQRTENTFKCLINKYNNIEFSSNRPVSSNITKQILKAFCEFENLSLELHKMIVAAEYCALCSCDRQKTR